MIFCLTCQETSPVAALKLWDSRNDVLLCIHCGVGLPGKIRLEMRAHNTRYVRLDNNNTFPPTRTCVAGAPDYLDTRVNLEAVLEELRGRLPDSDELVELSINAGRFLCEFTYFFSMQLGRAPVLFVHVPPLSESVSLADLVVRLRTIIGSTLAVLRQSLLTTASTASSGVAASPAPMPSSPASTLASHVGSLRKPGVRLCMHPHVNFVGIPRVARSLTP